MRPSWLLALLLLTVACRTRIEDPPDGASITSADAGADLSGPANAIACGNLLCDAITEVCVYEDRGDCARYTCAPVPAACIHDRTCSCVGNSFCDPFVQGSETLTCTPSSFPPGPDVIVCRSTTQCI